MTVTDQVERSPAFPDPPWQPGRRTALIAAVCVVVLVLGLVGWRVNQTHAPFGPDDIDVQFSMEVLQATDDGATNVQARVTELGMGGAAAGFPGPNVVGTITVRAPEVDGYGWDLLLIDKRTQTVLDVLSAGPEPVTLGWQGAWSELATRYSYLAPVADVATGAGVTNASETIGFSTGQRVVFAASHGPGEDPETGEPFVPTTPATTSDVLAVLLLEGPGGKAVWATRIAW